MDIEQKEQVMEDKKKLFASIRSDIDSLLTSTGSLGRQVLATS